MKASLPHRSITVKPSSPRRHHRVGIASPLRSRNVGVACHRVAVTSTLNRFGVALPSRRSRVGVALYIVMASHRHRVGLASPSRRCCVSVGIALSSCRCRRQKAVTSASSLCRVGLRNDACASDVYYFVLACLGSVKSSSRMHLRPLTWGRIKLMWRDEDWWTHAFLCWCKTDVITRNIACVITRNVTRNYRNVTGPSNPRDSVLVSTNSLPEESGDWLPSLAFCFSQTAARRKVGIG